MKIQRLGLGRCLVVASVFLSLTGAAWAAGSATIIYPTGTAEQNVLAVQAALDNELYDTIVLKGVFDFGDDGFVQITRRGTTLTGPATIQGGSVPVEVAALNTRVNRLTFEAPEFAAIVVSVAEQGTGYVKIRGNSMSDCFAGIAVFPVTEIPGTNVSLGIHRNTISDCDFGVYVDAYSPFTYATTIRKNRIENITYDGVFVWTLDAPLDIISNRFANAAFEAIWVGSWFLGGHEDPEYGDNPPVNILRNTIVINDVPENGVAEGAAGIMVGISHSGINNVLVKGNTLRGVATYGGLVKQPYGHNNRFIGNDLSELTTYGPQIWLMGGRNNLFLHNVLGETREWATFDWVEGAILDETAATLSSTANWHSADLNTPDPVNYGNVFIANDYRATGLPGGYEDDELGDPRFAGSVLLLDFIQKYKEGSEPYELDPYTEDFSTENIVFELGKFPRVDGKKTNVCTQVRDKSNLLPDDMIPGDNHVAGWYLCEWMARRH